MPKIGSKVAVSLLVVSAVAQQGSIYDDITVDVPAGQFAYASKAHPETRNDVQGFVVTHSIRNKAPKRPLSVEWKDADILRVGSYQLGPGEEASCTEWENKPNKTKSQLFYGPTSRYPADAQLYKEFRPQGYEDLACRVKDEGGAILGLLKIVFKLLTDSASDQPHSWCNGCLLVGAKADSYEMTIESSGRSSMLYLAVSDEVGELLLKSSTTKFGYVEMPIEDLVDLIDKNPPEYSSMAGIATATGTVTGGAAIGGLASGSRLGIGVGAASGLVFDVAAWALSARHLRDQRERRIKMLRRWLGSPDRPNPQKCFVINYTNREAKDSFVGRNWRFVFEGKPSKTQSVNLIGWGPERGGVFGFGLNLPLPEENKLATQAQDESSGPLGHRPHD